MLRVVSCRRAGAFQRSVALQNKKFVEQLKDLRFRTDAPISDCSAALKESNGDLNAAIEILRKKGAARAVKKGDRITQFGFVGACVSASNGAAVLRMCTETDFAARNEYFLKVSGKVKDALTGLIDNTKGAVLADPAAAVEELRKMLKDDITTTIAALGENVTIDTIQPLALDLADKPEGAALSIGSYTHGSLGVADIGRIVGLAGVYSADAANAEPINRKDSDDLARHFVANFGDDSAYQHQSFLGTEETVSKWLKRHNVKFAGSMVIEFGKEPILRFPPKIPPRK